MNDMGSRGAPSGYSSTTAPTGPPASSGYGGRGGMPDGRGGMPDGRGGMPDMHGGMPDGRGGMSDSPQMSSARPFDTIIIRNLPLDCNWQVLREGKFGFNLIFLDLTIQLQVNLCRKLSFLNQLTQNLTRDCSLNSRKNTSSQHVLYSFCFCFDIQNNICTQHVLNLYFSGDHMYHPSSYCGLTDSRMRASDTDLPVIELLNLKKSD